MKRLFILVLLCGAIYSAAAQQKEAIVKDFFEQMGAGNYTGATKYMQTSMLQKVNADMLKGVWQQLEQQHGKWEAVVSQKIIFDGRNYIITAGNNFERALLQFRVALDSTNKIIGFFLIGAKDKQVIYSRNETPDTIQTTDGGILYGTLTQPEGIQHAPVVLIIAGSGPTDRNGNSLFDLGPNGYSYRQLAEGLAANGIASLRYDKRWVGQSTGFARAPVFTTLDDYTSDAISCVQHLQRSGKFQAVSVIGHSEGGLIGLMMAKDIPFKCLISLSTPGESMDKVVLEQLKPRLSDTLYRQAAVILNDLKEDKAPANVPDQLNTIFNPNNFTFWKSTFHFDPCALLPVAKMPVLLVGGTADVQVKPAQVTLLKGCKPGTNAVMINGMTHLLKSSNAVSPDNKSPLPLSPELLPALVSFVKQ